MLKRIRLKLRRALAKERREMLHGDRTHRGVRVHRLRWNTPRCCIRLPRSFGRKYHQSHHDEECRGKRGDKDQGSPVLGQMYHE
jgi:hypothetical protein